MRGIPKFDKSPRGWLAHAYSRNSELSSGIHFNRSSGPTIGSCSVLWILVCILVALTSGETFAQPVCRWDMIQVAGPNGACCNVRVRWCDQVVAGVYIQEIDSIEQPTMEQGYDCASLGANYMLQVIRKKLLLMYVHQNHMLCPQFTTRLFQQTHSSCYKIVGGFLVPCGLSKCTWTCNVCITPKERGNCSSDPLEDYDVFYLNCSVRVGSCGGITGCTINVCS